MLPLRKYAEQQLLTQKIGCGGACHCRGFFVSRC